MAKETLCTELVKDLEAFQSLGVQMARGCSSFSGVSCLVLDYPVLAQSEGKDGWYRLIW
jgi:hypothetical protein